MSKDTYGLPTSSKRTAFDMIKENQMWGEIREMAKVDPGMADLVDRVIVYYRLKKEAR